jgi:hypothetical protein
MQVSGSFTKAEAEFFHAKAFIAKVIPGANMAMRKLKLQRYGTGSVG